MSALFSNPITAWLLPAILLPILFRLFFPLKRPMHSFPSLMFFTRSTPRPTVRWRFHEWLVLLLRCLLITLVLLAFLRPLIRLPGRGAVARLILIDNSASMAGPSASNSSKFDLAVHATEQFLKLSHPGDSISVRLIIPDSSLTVPNGFNPDLDVLQNSLEKVKPTDAAASALLSVRSALIALSAEQQPVHELHIFTDLEQKNWGVGKIENGASFPPIRIIVHRLESPSPGGGWISLQSDYIPNVPIPEGRMTSVRFTLHNYGTSKGTVYLNTTDDMGKNTFLELVVKAGEVLPVSTTFSFTHPGFHWGRVWIEGDAAEGADRVPLGFWIKESEKSCFLGNLELYGALPSAVSPGGSANLSGINTQALSQDRIVSGLADMPICVGSTYEDWIGTNSNARFLEGYVRAGGTLFLVPPGASGSQIFGAFPESLSLSVGVLTKPERSESMITLHPSDPIWQNLRDNSGNPELGQLQLTQFYPLKISPDWDPLISSANGSTLLARRSLGKGTILASGVAFLPGWSSLPLRPGFVVLIQNAIFPPSSAHIPVQTMAAGEEVQVHDPLSSLTVHSLVDGDLSWEGSPKEFPGLFHEGVYEIKQGGKFSWTVVHSVDTQSNQDFLPRRPVPLLGSLPHHVVALSNESDFQRVLPGSTRSTGSRSTFYGWFLGLALLVLLLETFLANERWNSKQRTTNTEQPTTNHKLIL